MSSSNLSLLIFGRSYLAAGCPCVFLRANAILRCVEPINSYTYRFHFSFSAAIVNIREKFALKLTDSWIELWRLTQQWSEQKVWIRAKNLHSAVYVLWTETSSARKFHCHTKRHSSDDSTSANVLSNAKVKLYLKSTPNKVNLLQSCWKYKCSSKSSPVTVWPNSSRTNESSSSDRIRCPGRHLIPVLNEKG